MATSTFGKKFEVRPDMARDFVKEMTRSVPPTLKRDFQTKLTHEKDLRSNLQKVLK